MTDDQRFVLDAERYSGHTPADEWHARYDDPTGDTPDARLERHAPKILAEALRLQADNERLRAVLVELRDGFDGEPYTLAEQALAAQAAREREDTQ